MSEEKRSSWSIAASSSVANKVLYSNQGKKLVDGQVYVAALEKCGDSYGSIIVNRKYVSVWSKFLDWAKETAAKDARGEIDKSKRADKNSADNTLSASFCWPEEVAAQIAAAFSAGRVRILEGDALAQAFADIPVVDDEAFVKSGPVDFPQFVKTYAMFSKSHTNKTSAGESSGGGVRRVSGKEPWRNVQNPDDGGLSGLKDRYAKITATSDIAVAIGTCAGELKDDIVVLGKPKDGGKPEIIKGRFLKFCQVSGCKEVDDDEWRLTFEVDIPSDAREQWELAQEILKAEEDIAPAKTALQEYIDSLIEKDEQAKALKAVLDAASTKAEKVKADFLKKFGPAEKEVPADAPTE